MDQAGKRLFLWCFATIGVMASLSLAKGGLYVDRHEGDTLHLIEILRRMELGQWPHLDFSTPLGVLAFLPIMVFVWAGLGVGTSIMLGQVLFAFLLLGPIWWTCHSRLGGKLGVGVAIGLIVLIMAMIHGEADPHVSLSMHYNRWAWALSFLAILLAALPSKGPERPILDGLILGSAMSFFILGKVTYGIAFAPGLLLAVGLRRQWKMLVTGVGTVVLVALVVTLFGGIAFWTAYLSDLFLVQGSSIRPRAGETLGVLVFGPRFLVGNIILGCGIWFLRQAENPDLGLILAALTPGFIYVTFQNSGNDPKWLALVAILLFVGGASARTRWLAAFAAILIAPTFLNMAISPVRHLILHSGHYQSVFPSSPHKDFKTIRNRMIRVLERRSVEFSETAFAVLNEGEKKQVELKGETFPECFQDIGLLGSMQAMADDLIAFGLGSEDTIFMVDTFGSLWMFGGFEPPKGGAPWYYGGLTGFADADYVLLPICPITPRAVRAITADLGPHANSLQEVRRTRLYVLYEKSEG